MQGLYETMEKMLHPRIKKTIETDGDITIGYYRAAASLLNEVDREVACILLRVQDLNDKMRIAEERVILMSLKADRETEEVIKAQTKKIEEIEIRRAERVKRHLVKNYSTEGIKFPL